MKNSDGFADAYDTSVAGPAFPTGGLDVWETTWCGGCSNAYAEGNGCVLTDVAMVGRIPAAWLELEHGGPANRFLCLSWEPRAGVEATGTQLADVLGMPVGRRS